MKAALMLAVSAASLSAHAQEWSYSGFGTLGVAVSDQAYNYQRFVSNSGTLKRDSILGLQVDAKFTPKWSATVQVKLAPSIDDDQHIQASASWAFVSWRPSNEWLLRGGKVRLPLYLFSEVQDVGQSYEFARMPVEMYSISPTTDIAGVYLTRNWALASSDLSLDVYSGRAASVAQRYFTRDAGAIFKEVRLRVSGGVLTLRSEDSAWRLGLHHAESAFNNGAVPSALQYQTQGPFGYYTPSAYAASISNDILTVGFDVNLPNAWRLVGEAERNVQHGTDIGANTVGGYVSVLRKVNRITPYATIAILKALGAPARLHAGLTQAGVPGADDLNAGQRMLADGMSFYDQRSIALGASLALTPHSKLKGEWLHTWVGKGSALVDSPAGGSAVAHEGIHVFSLSYNIVF